MLCIPSCYLFKQWEQCELVIILYLYISYWSISICTVFLCTKHCFIYNLKRLFIA
nr:MAG TPA: hypothetical protein [Crassvirales sp.]